MNHNEIIEKLQQLGESPFGDEKDENPTDTELSYYRRDSVSFASAIPIMHYWAHDKVLSMLQKDDVVLDAGCGCCVFAYRASLKVKKVYAIDLNVDLIIKALSILSWNLPKNLIIICGDWVNFPVPKDVTVITCLVNGAVIPFWWREHKRVFNKNEEITTIEKEA